VGRARHQLLARGKPAAHLLHIGKTGGSAMKTVLRPVAARGTFVLQLHPHRTTLVDVPVGESVFFGIRDPESRFVSGFYSRQRRGRAGHDVGWTAGEAEAFSVFESANQLAEALFSDERAARAMAEIGHVRTSYWDWFVDRDTFLSRTDDILLITRQSHLATDFARLVDVLGLPGIELPRDPVAAHRNPVPVEPLTSKAKDNLRQWYEADYDFLALCQPLLPDQSS
jgi:hypothetical protein